MTIYVIEHKVKKIWWPLSMYATSGTHQNGLLHEAHSCVHTNQEQSKEAFEAIKITYPNDKFRVMEYIRKEKP